MRRVKGRYQACRLGPYVAFFLASQLAGWLEFDKKYSVTNILGGSMLDCGAQVLQSGIAGQLSALRLVDTVCDCSLERHFADSPAPGEPAGQGRTAALLFKRQLTF